MWISRQDYTLALKKAYESGVTQGKLLATAKVLNKDLEVVLEQAKDINAKARELRDKVKK